MAHVIGFDTESQEFGCGRNLCRFLSNSEYSRERTLATIIPRWGYACTINCAQAVLRIRELCGLQDLHSLETQDVVCFHSMKLPGKAEKCKIPHFGLLGILANLFDSTNSCTSSWIERLGFLQESLRFIQVGSGLIFNDPRTGWVSGTLGLIFTILGRADSQGPQESCQSGQRAVHYVGLCDLARVA